MITSLLVRWAGGWTEVHDDTAIASYGRQEGLLGLGAVGTTDELTRVATEQLRAYGRPRVEIAADLWPTGVDDVPFADFNLGDTITLPGMSGGTASERVIGLTVAEDDNGRLSWTPELKDALLTRQERLEQAVAKMNQGTVGGQSKVATPAAYISFNTSKDCCPPTPPALPTLTGTGTQVNTGTTDSFAFASPLNVDTMTVDAEDIWYLEGAPADVELLYDDGATETTIGELTIDPWLEGHHQVLDLRVNGVAQAFASGSFRFRFGAQAAGSTTAINLLVTVPLNDYDGTSYSVTWDVQ